MKRKLIEKAEKRGKIYVLEHLFLLEGVVRMCVYCKIIIPKLTKRVLNCVSKKQMQKPNHLLEMF